MCVWSFHDYVLLFFAVVVVFMMFSSLAVDAVQYKTKKEELSQLQSNSCVQGASKDCSRARVSRVRDLVQEGSRNLLEESEAPSDLLE